MKWAKPSPEIIKAFDQRLPKVSGVEKRQMFGYPAGFINGTWFMGCFQENDIVLRLSDKDREEFLKLEQARQFEPMPGRAMREFVVIPSWLMSNPEQMMMWIYRALEYAAQLPPKTKKSKRSRA